MSLLDWPGKSAHGDGVEHPALYHMLDVGAVAERLLLETEITPAVRAAFSLSAALHDLGKISNSFREMLRNGRVQAEGRHWEVTEAWLHHFDARLAPIMADPYDRADLYAAIAGHHGRPPFREGLDRMIFAAGKGAEEDAGAALNVLMGLWPGAKLDMPYEDVLALTWWLPGLISVADWIGSNQEFFPPVAPGPSPDEYLVQARERARAAVRLAGLDLPAVSQRPVIPDSWTLRPMQQAAQEVTLPSGPVLALIEDETGSGKTEAALILAQRMMQAGKGGGVFFALPTMATANAMFGRAAGLVARLYETAPSLALAHGRAVLSENFRSLIRPERSPASPSCTVWLADDRRRALLANIGVGTVDQALLSALPVRHAMLRHYALSQKILIVDEVHEMGDPYMAEEVCRLLELHRRVGGSAILMTATMPLELRARLCRAYGHEAPADSAYPALTVAGHGQITGLRSVNQRGAVGVQRVPEGGAAVQLLVEAAGSGAAGLWVRNAVDDAIRGVEELRARGIAADLLHARFTLHDRMRHEQAALQIYGKARDARPGRVLVATQVVESSLDLDFDVMVSDLAPIPALVQRAGRLWRHMAERPAEARPCPAPVLHVLSPDPEQVADAKWLSRVLERGAFTYPLDLQWRAARAVFDAGQIDGPEGLRHLIEEGLSGGILPEPLLQAEREREAQGYAATDLARQNLVTLDKPYREIKGFAEDADFPTRLGQPQRVLVLARQEGGVLVPLAGDHWNATSRQMSEVTAAARKLDGLPLPDQSAPAIAAVKREWPDWMQAGLRVCPVADSGEICEGLSYDAERGLIFGGGSGG
ncbi:CRISPR-associated helicase Cas3' [Leisingera caerulea]|uniref:CRISPR-associated helicase Cas3' n=1 Tax=Leisingera caerulea TaxID=506591 RepID=UPI0021A63456|nr:CRISPR-associated helicase Cas3' [Leisingera caerulea]UWQ62796.1 CRISPR-associated helicase Cas3' [Leisingera caerulea]